MGLLLISYWFVDSLSARLLNPFIVKGYAYLHNDSSLSLVVVEQNFPEGKFFNTFSGTWQRIRLIEWNSEGYKVRNKLVLKTRYGEYVDTVIFYPETNGYCIIVEDDKLSKAKIVFRVMHSRMDTINLSSNVIPEVYRWDPKGNLHILGRSPRDSGFNIDFVFLYDGGILRSTTYFNLNRAHFIPFSKDTLFYVYKGDLLVNDSIIKKGERFVGGLEYTEPFFIDNQCYFPEAGIYTQFPEDRGGGENELTSSFNSLVLSINNGLKREVLIKLVKFDKKVEVVMDTIFKYKKENR